VINLSHPHYCEACFLKKKHVSVLEDPAARVLRSIEDRRLMSFNVSSTIALTNGAAIEAFWLPFLDTLQEKAPPSSTTPFRPEFGVELDIGYNYPMIMTVLISFQDNRIRMWANDGYCGSCAINTSCQKTFYNLFTKKSEPTSPGDVATRAAPDK
jgi:hypothetical protein